MALINFTSLDFDQIKTTIREYLRANSNFTDYDYEGSNLSTIIDALAYTSYLSSYNANMVSNEVFIDSATLRENVVSLAKHIGYIPKSVRSARAEISFFVDTSELTNQPLYVKLLKGLVCSSSLSVSGRSYTFSITEDVIVPVVEGIASFNNLEIIEGTFLTNTFTVNANDRSQRFILENTNIDTSSLKVVVRESRESNISRVYELCRDLCVIDSESEVYFIQEIEDERYEIIFGDGIFGKKLENNNIVEISYIISNGTSEANQISSFSYSGRIYDEKNRVLDFGPSLLTTNAISQGGQEIESVDSIRKFAPLLYSSQKRAVTTSDYEGIISQIYPEAESVSVFGGEELTPPQYGKVFITIKPYEGERLPISIKENIKTDLRKYCVAGIVPEILDLKYLYVEFDSSVYYNINKTKGVFDTRSKIIENAVKYADSTELNKYGAKFKYSKFLRIIDDTDASITSNITKIQIRRDLRVLTNTLAEYELCFGNEFYVTDNCKEGYNIKSSGFKVSNSQYTVYLSDIPIDKTRGELIIFRMQSDKPVVIQRNFGEINYKKGEISIYPTNIISTLKTKFDENVIEISVTPKSNDVIGLQDLYLQLDVDNSVVNMVRDTISSNEDSSGSTHISSSSYTNGKLIRN